MGVVAAETAAQTLSTSLGETICRGSISFYKNAMGKPYLVIAGKKSRNTAISISHSFPYAVAVAQKGKGRVGCDVERVRDFAPATSDAFLTHEEKIVLAHYPPKIKKLKTTLAWSFKESILKATGTGLRTHPSKVDVSELLKIIQQEYVSVKVNRKNLVFNAWYTILSQAYVTTVVAEIV